MHLCINLPPLCSCLYCPWANSQYVLYKVSWDIHLSMGHLRHNLRVPARQSLSSAPVKVRKVPTIRSYKIQCNLDLVAIFQNIIFLIYYIKSYNLVTLFDFIMVFAETKSVNKPRVHYSCLWNFERSTPFAFGFTFTFFNHYDDYFFRKHHKM